MLSIIGENTYFVSDVNKVEESPKFNDFSVRENIKCRSKDKSIKYIDENLSNYHRLDHSFYQAPIFKQVQ